MKAHKKRRDKRTPRPDSVMFNDDYIRRAGWTANQWMKQGILTREEAITMYRKEIERVNRHQGLDNKYDGKGRLRRIDTEPESVS